jgi:hypothetical protein
VHARETDKIQDVGNTLADLIFRHLLGLERERDILLHGHMRPDRVGLENHAKVSLVGRKPEALVGDNYGFFAKVDGPGVGDL